jgi:hypothetical protein
LEIDLGRVAFGCGAPARTQGHARTDARLALAVGGADAPRERLASSGWIVIDPLPATRHPGTYRDFIAASKAEFRVAKHGYVVSHCGWFSERSVAYLAMNAVADARVDVRSRPAIAFLRYADVFEDFRPRHGIGQREFATPRHGSGNHAFLRLPQREVEDARCDADWADVEPLIAEWRLSFPAVGARLRPNFEGVR